MINTSLAPSYSTIAARILYGIAAAACFTSWITPPIALAMGTVLALALPNPYPGVAKKLTKPLLQVSVVLLGFSMELPVVLRAGAEGIVFAAVVIAFTISLGFLLGHWMKIDRKTTALIAAGTAICGGSAIAAVASVIGVGQGEISVAMGTVFILNGIALYLFPLLGRVLHLTQIQFGTWAGVAIHDISSVVGAANSYGQVALERATAVKLSRALWIAPLSVVAALAFPRKEGERKQKWSAQVPWFIGLFLIASICRSYIAPVADAAPLLSQIAKRGLTLTLFLIGASLSKETLRAVGWRPLVQGVALWMFIATLSLAVILKVG